MTTNKKVYNFYMSVKLREALDECLYTMRYKSRGWIIQKALFEYLKKSEHVIPEDAEESSYI